MLPCDRPLALRILPVEMAKGGRRSSDRPLSRPKKRRFYGKARSVEPEQSASDQPAESASSSKSESASASKLRTLPSVCTPFDRYDRSSSSSSCESSSSESDVSDDDCPDSSDNDQDCSGLSDDDGCECDSELDGYRVVDMSCLAALITSSCSCSDCGGTLSLSERRRWGMAAELSLQCSGCGMGTAQVMSRKVGRFLEVNRRAVFAGRAVGMARERLVRFCALMNMPTPMSKSTYQRHQAALLNAANTVAQQSLDNAAETVRKLGEEEGSTSPGDIPVTFDGTWMRRGHTSLHGAVTVISLATGQLLDYEVYTKFCHTCTRKRSDVAAGRMTQAEFTAWYETHQRAVTTTGSSGSMEVQGARDLWQRSMEWQLRYVTFIGDWDCKAHNAVVEQNPYGPEVPVEKEECVGHVQKRVGTRLRELKKKLVHSKLADGKPIGGAGRLSDRMI